MRGQRPRRRWSTSCPIPLGRPRWGGAGASGRGALTGATSRVKFRSVIGGAARWPSLRSYAGVAPADGARAVAGALLIVTVTHDSAPELRGAAGIGRSPPPGRARGRRGLRLSGCQRAGGPGAARRDVVALGENVGFGRACNRGLALVSEPVVALLNPDVELIDDSLHRARRASRAGRISVSGCWPRGCSTPTAASRTPPTSLPGSTADLVRSLVPPGLVGGRAGGARAVALRPSAARRLGGGVRDPGGQSGHRYGRSAPLTSRSSCTGRTWSWGLRAAGAGVPTWLWPGGPRRATTGPTRPRWPSAVSRSCALARARHDVVARSLGRRRAALDDALQLVTFASRVVGRRRMLRGPGPARGRAQLQAVLALRHGGPRPDDEGTAPGARRGRGADWSRRSRS